MKERVTMEDMEKLHEALSLATDETTEHPAEAEEKKVATNPVGIMETLVATRMRIRDMLPVLEEMDEIGYTAIEAWGGATFDSCLRFLDEDPWERLRILRQHLKKTPIQMLLRGQNLLGYKNYPDDVVCEFVKRSVDNGVRVLRIFDALNDTRNLETSIRAAKEQGAQVQGAIVYTISPYHQDHDFVRIAKELVELGSDSVCIKDMSGLLTPYAAESLVRALKAEITVPIQLHSHFTSGMADMTYLKAIEAGVDVIDCALSPFSSMTSQPCTESMVATLRGTPRDTGLPFETLCKLATHFRGVKARIVDEFKLNLPANIDPKVLTYQIPGGMLSNLMNQMKEMGIGDKYEEMLQEMPRVRAELGYPSLVTPTSQIVGSMAVLNTALGRYAMVPREVKDLILGLYGRTPGPIDPEVRRLAVGDQPSIDHRPADDLEPMLDTMRAKLDRAGYPGASMEDLLSYISFPEVALAFFKKHGKVRY